MTGGNNLSEGLAFHRAGKVNAAKRIYEEIISVDPYNAVAVHYLGLAWMQSGNLALADTFLSRAVALDAENINALADLGAVKAKRQEYELSVSVLSRVLEKQPTHTDALGNLAAVFEMLHRTDSALPLLERRLELCPDSASAFLQLAQSCFKLGDATRAMSLLQDAIAIDASFCKARMFLGEVLEASGKFRQAQAQYLHVLRREPNNAIALAKLLQLRDARIAPGWADRASAIFRSNTLPHLDYVRLRVAMGFYYDREGDYDRAFDNFHAGYELERRKNPFDMRTYTSVIDRLIHAFSGALFEKWTGAGSRVRKPIFIVGMPRSGTTLVEQILASHPAVAGGGELSTLMAIASQLDVTAQGNPPYPEGLRTVTADHLDQMAQRYLSHLDRISGSAQRVTDKQPFNFMHLGLAQLLFPHATFIHCQRDPMDTCISCYFVSFADSFAFANDLSTLGKYYCQYSRLMTHWQSVLPSPVLNVEYESLVADFENVVRKIVAHCGLPWNDACLRFYETQRLVRTPSRWQVRQPIYANSVGRWKRYARHLEPLRVALQG